MSRFLILLVIVATFSIAASVKEWKNFENGKVYSHKTINDKKEIKTHGAHRGPVVEERLLHSHHRDKKAHHQLKSNRLQEPETKELHSKNAERHHKKNIEEEMHLKPLNERHHKFPNPALLDKTAASKPPNPQISKQKLLKQVKSGKLNNHRRLRGRRYKRNKSDQKLHELAEKSKSTLKDQELKIKNESLTESSPAKETAIKVLSVKGKNNGKFPPKLPSYW